MDQRQTDHVAVTEGNEEMSVGPMLVDKLEVCLYLINKIAIWVQHWRHCKAQICRTFHY